MSARAYPKGVNPLLYFLVVLPVRVFARLMYGLKVVKKPGVDIKPPYVVLSNHQSNIDAFITACAIYPVRPHYVVGRYHFRNPLKRFVFRLIGAIPKEQFFPDFASILEMKRVIERGEVLFLFPSGQSSYTGECTYIPEGIGRLLKRLNAPVLHVHIEGAHLTYPKWDMSRKRKTAVHATVAPLFERGELKALDAREVYARVCQALYFDDYEWQRAHMLAAKAPRGVVGLEYILFMCPQCGEEFRMHTNVSVISCGACGYAASMDEYGFLHAADGGEAICGTPVRWARMQAETLSARLDADPAYAIKHDVLLYKCGHNGAFYEISQGILTLSADGLNFDAASARQPYSLRIDASMYPVFPHEQKDSFEAYADGELYRFVPRQKNTAYKFVMLGEVLYRRARNADAGAPETGHDVPA